MPERTTEDYVGDPSMKVRQAITAILQEEPTREVIPISTLINFNDRILEEYGQKEAAAGVVAGAARPKSGKRPKSAKKKKVA
jgi:hypothetical protein